VRAFEDQPLHFLAPEFYSKNVLHVYGLNVTDPDYLDFGFDARTITVNISCKHGRIFLNEEFLKTKGIAGTRIKFKTWSSTQELRGVHNVEYDQIGRYAIVSCAVPLLARTKSPMPNDALMPL
jgi:hypothetical protein